MPHAMVDTAVGGEGDGTLSRDALSQAAQVLEGKMGRTPLQSEDGEVGVPDIYEGPGANESRGGLCENAAGLGVEGAGSQTAKAKRREAGISGDDARRA